MQLSSLGLWLLPILYLVSVGSLACMGFLYLILIYAFQNHFVFSAPKRTILGKWKLLTIYQLLKNSLFNDQSIILKMPFHFGKRKTTKK